MLLLVGALGVALRTPPLGATPLGAVIAPRRSAVRLQHTAAAAASAWGGALTSHDPQTVSVGEPYFRFFTDVASSADFVRDEWTRAPKLWSEPYDGIAGSYTLADVETAVDSDFLDAGRGVPDKEGGWKMAPVSQPRGASYADAKMRYVDVEASLRKGTVVFNSAGAHIPKLAAVSLAALDALSLPTCLNLYLTGHGVPVSAPPHTDKQDVFVFQSKGAKHWRVYAPPEPALRVGSDPFARGKGDDQLSMDELGPPLIEATLTPGMVLYVPAGFPHTTHTDDEADPDHSVSLTVGVDTHIWGLNLASARAGVLTRAAEHDNLGPLTGLGPEAYWQLHGVPRNVGFLGKYSADAETKAELAAAIRVVEPERWEGADDAEIAEKLDLDAAVDALATHAAALVEVQRALYVDAIADDAPATVADEKASFMRVRPHMALLEHAMESHLAWYARSPPPPQPPPPPVRPPPGSAPTAPAGKPAKSSGFGGGAAKPAKAGFGGGGGKKPAKKGGKAKGKKRR